MDDTKDKPSRVLSIMKQSRVYWNIRKEVIQHLLKNRKDGWQPTPQEIIKALGALGFEEQLRTVAQNCTNRTVKRIPLEKDNMPEIQTLKLKWCEHIIRAFRAVTSKLRKDEQDEQEDESVNYVYDAETLLQFLTTVKTKLGFKTRQLQIYLFQYEVFRIPKYGEIKGRFDFIVSGQNINGKERDNITYREREKKAVKLLENELMQTDIERFLLYGSTNGERGQLYMKYFQIEEDQRLISSLLEEIQKKTNPFDNIVTADVADILTDERYFVFKEQLRKLIKMFVRDRTIQEKVKIKPHIFTGLEVEVSKQEIPLSQILPCKMLSRYIAPFCYTSLKLQTIYSIFREFYCNYFCLLHSVSSEQSSILYLALLFQELLDTTERKMSTHFASLGLQPLRLVFPWIFYCFIGYVDIEQVFYIFDRIVAMKSLEILPTYAMALLFKQKAAILQSKTAAEVEEILEDLPKGDNMADTLKYYLTYHL